MQSITPEPEGRVRGAANETFRSLRIRNFRLFFGGQIVSQAGNWMTLITQTLLVLHLTHNGVAVGLMTAASSSRCSCSARGRAWSPTAPTSASC